MAIYRSPYIHKLEEEIISWLKSEKGVCFSLFKLLLRPVALSLISQLIHARFIALPFLTPSTQETCPYRSIRYTFCMRSAEKSPSYIGRSGIGYYLFNTNIRKIFLGFAHRAYSWYPLMYRCKILKTRDLITIYRILSVNNTPVQKRVIHPKTQKKADPKGLPFLFSLVN